VGRHANRRAEAQAAQEKDKIKVPLEPQQNEQGIMARKDGIDGGGRAKNRISLGVRLYADGRQRCFRCDTKSQTKPFDGHK